MIREIPWKLHPARNENVTLTASNGKHHWTHLSCKTISLCAAIEMCKQIFMFRLKLSESADENEKKWNTGKQRSTMCASRELKQKTIKWKEKLSKRSEKAFS